MTTPHAVLIVGTGARGRSVQAALGAAGVGHIEMLDGVERAAFDDDTDSWALHTDDDVVRTRVVVAARPAPATPWVPRINGQNDFRGDSLHAAKWDNNFHATGKRIAVVGTDSFAGHRLRRLVESASAVTVFPHAPRRVVTDIELWPTRVKRRLLRRTCSGPHVAPPIESITATGIHTVDGGEHSVDAIIYGTGFTIEDDPPLAGSGGLTLRQTWVDGMEPFFGVAVRGFPNYFLVAGPDVNAQARYIADCVALLHRSGSRRIEVRHSSQQVYNERAQLAPAPPPPAASAFDLSAYAPDYEDTYDGEATLEVGGTRHPVRVRLVGHLDPLDGNYHWQGTVFDVAELSRERVGTLSVGRHSATARIVEQTPWGTHSVAGVGAPPYARNG
ncbi:DUF4873 domain-containing protein [Mycobacterium camsae]|uniref:DUF4873 domain-containing protein n=1 Tax=Mycobacterium gordonae TaxID=1778 RepID=UPI001F11B371|nr:DUF4873 domain-containing protein [Mycobacterium gordonae]